MRHKSNVNNNCGKIRSADDVRNDNADSTNANIRTRRTAGLIAVTTVKITVRIFMAVIRFKIKYVKSVKISPC
jgi:hypothetical protein